MKLLDYSIRETFNLFMCYFLTLLLIKSFNNGEYICLLYAFVVSLEVDSMTTRFNKFKLYYPDFKNEWENVVS